MWTPLLVEWTLLRQIQGTKKERERESILSCYFVINVQCNFWKYHYIPAKLMKLNSNSREKQKEKERERGRGREREREGEREGGRERGEARQRKTVFSRCPSFRSGRILGHF